MYVKLEICFPYSIKEIFSRAKREQLSEIRQAAKEMMGNDSKLARHYLCRPHMLLVYKSPFSVAAKSTEGYEQIKRMIGIASYGGAV